MGDEAAEKAWADYRQWRADEGNYGREGDEPSFIAGRASVHDTFDGLRSRIAALEAVIERVREAARENAADGDLFYSTYHVDRALGLAPSVVLDQMIREAKSEAWDAGFMRLDDWMVTHVIDTDGAKAPDRFANPYRNGDA